MRIYFIASIALLFLTLNLKGQHSATLEQAAAAFQKGDYQTAISFYEQLLSDDIHSEELYYNLGNCYFKNEQLGNAILNYERVLLLDANDEDALHNLAVARLQLKDEITTIPPFFLEKWWRNLRGLASPNLWGLLGLLLFWSGIGGLVIWQMGKMRDQRKKGFLLGMILLLLSLIPILLAMSAFGHANNSNEAIILAEEVPLHNGPDKLSKEILVLHEGTKVELLDLIKSWYKVRLANGEKGWITAGTFEEI